MPTPSGAAFTAYPNVPTPQEVERATREQEVQQRVRELEAQVEQLQAKLDAAHCSDVNGLARCAHACHVKAMGIFCLAAAAIHLFSIMSTTQRTHAAAPQAPDCLMSAHQPSSLQTKPST